MNQKLAKPELVYLLELAQKFATSTRSPATVRAYRIDWSAFVAWCGGVNVSPLPAAPETVAAYLAQLDVNGRKPAGLERVLVSLSQAHQLAGVASPCASALVRETLKGIKRERGTAQKQAAPVLVPHLRRMLRSLPRTVRGTRDRALLLVGFAGAFRPGEISGLNVDDIEIVTEGAKVRLARSKTDQLGKGACVGIPYGQHPETCPVSALRRWMEAAGIDGGPLFRSIDRHGNIHDGRLTARSVGRVVTGAAKAAGLDADHISGHSLRAGFATAAAKAGTSENMIMKQTRHKSGAMLHRYIRDGELFTRNAVHGLL